MFKQFFPLVALVLLASCSSNELMIENDSYVTMNRIPASEIIEMAEDVSILYDNYNELSSRTSDPLELSNDMALTERKVAERCAQLVEEGQEVRQQILQLQETAPETIAFTDEELLEIVNMSDDQLASLALQLSVISEYQEFVKITDERLTTSNVYFDCFLYAIGVDDLWDMIDWGKTLVFGGTDATFIVAGTKIIMNNKTARKLLFGFAMRYAGWIGVAHMLYDFTTCVNSNK